MNAGIRTVIYPVRDLARSKPLYEALLGTAACVDEPYYVGFRLGEQQIGLDPHGRGTGPSGPVGYYHVQDLEAVLKELLGRGATRQGEICDIGRERIVAVADADGNAFGLRQLS